MELKYPNWILILPSNHSSSQVPYINNLYHYLFNRGMIMICDISYSALPLCWCHLYISIWINEKKPFPNPKPKTWRIIAQKWKELLPSHLGGFFISLWKYQTLVTFIWYYPPLCWYQVNPISEGLYLQCSGVTKGWPLSAAHLLA